MSVVRSAFASRAAVAACAATSGRPKTSRRDPRRQLLDPLGLVAVAAQLLVEEHRVQPLEPGLERASCGPASQKNFASRSRAATTRSAFFAMTPLVGGCVLTTARNASFNVARLGHHRKVVLVVHERRRQHFLGQREERRDRRSRRRRRDTRRDPRLPRRAPAWSFSVHAAAEAAGVHLQLAARSGRGARNDSRTTKCSASRAWYSSKLRTLIDRPARPLVARNRWP